MVTFVQDKQTGKKNWYVTFDSTVYRCVNQDVANELAKLFMQRAVKVVHDQEGAA